MAVCQMRYSTVDLAIIAAYPHSQTIVAIILSLLFLQKKKKNYAMYIHTWIYFWVDKSIGA